MSNVAPKSIFCEHGLNARACLKCFHKPKPRAAPGPAVPASNPTQARANALIAAAKTSAQQSNAVPAGAQVVPGAAQQVPPIQNVPLPHVARPKKIKSLDDDKQAQSNVASMTGGFTYETRTAPIPYGERQWEPPPRTGKERKDLIEQLPRHPKPNG